MKFGLFYLVQSGDSRTPDTEHRRFWETVEEVTYAEEMGFHSAWFAEHHFEPEHSFSSTPEVTLAALSQRTSEMRLGFAVALLPIHHPLRLAAQIATMDILSNGRIDFGAGRSKNLFQLSPFGISLEDARGMEMESLSIIPRMWTEDVFSHEGQYYQIPPREVTPKPVQQPHPPMWLACSQDDTTQMAGEMGIGCLMNVSGGAEKMARSIAIYKQAVKNAKPVGKYVNDRVIASLMALCDEDHNHALERGGNIGAWSKNAGVVRNTRSWENVDNSTVPSDYQVYVPGGGFRPTELTSPEEFLQKGGYCIGDPDACIKTLEQYEATGIDEVMCSTQHGPTTHEEVMNTIRLFGKYVIPHFQAKEKQNSPTTPPGDAVS